MTTLSAKGDVDGSTPSHTQGMFKTGVGKMWQAFVDLFGTDSGAMRTVHETAKLNGPGILQNLKLTPTVGSNALTMTVQTRAGAGPSAADPVLVSVRNATATAGDSLLRQVSATLALVISSGSTLGHSSGAAGTIYWYLVDSDGAGTMKLAASSTYYGPSFIGTTVAEGGAGAADSASVIYSDAIYSNKAMRLVGKTIDTQTTAGTWTALPSQVDLWPFDAPVTASVARGALAGLRLSTAGASTTMTTAAGQAADSANAVLIDLASSIGKTTGAWAVGTGNGGLDTGAIANNTWYHFHLIRRPDTGVVDVLFSLSASAPTLPANYTQSRRIGAGRTNGSAQWTSFVQFGDYFRWDTPILDISATNPGTAAVTRTLTVPTGVNVMAVMNVATLGGGATNAAVYLSELDAADLAPSYTVAPLITEGGNFGAASTTGGQAIIKTNTSAQIRSRMNNSGTGETLYIATLGWYDLRGRAD